MVISPTLQKASEEDIEILINLEKSVSKSKVYSAMLDENDWKEEIRKGTTYLIKNDDEVVGNISYEQKSLDRIYIGGLVISPPHQGKGIARTVLNLILKQYSKVARIDLVTHPDNPALKLYESLGFKVEDRKENYYGDGEPRLVLALVR